MPSNLRLVEELLHQELVLNIVVRELVDTKEIETTVVLDASFQPLRVFSLQPQQLTAKERIRNPPGTDPFLASFRCKGFSHPGLSGTGGTPNNQIFLVADKVQVAKAVDILQVKLNTPAEAGQLDR